jgi:hypothetical protein
MSSQCAVAAGAEDDWRKSSVGCDIGTDIAPPDETWTATGNLKVDGKSRTGGFLLREERKETAEMRLSADGSVGIGTQSVGKMVMVR